MRPLPDWVHEGAIAGMQGGTARVREVWQQLREHGTPIAAFWLQDWELDRERYPQWKALRDDLAANGIRVLVYADEETLAHFSRCARIYRAWRDYRRRLVAEAAATGLPVVRHPFIHYPDDPEVYRFSYREFMVGSELLAAPVLDPDRDRVRVYLPAGRWTHLWSGATYGAAQRGTWIAVDAPLGWPAVFFRVGSPVGAQIVANLRAEGLLAPP